jgi:carbon storage regulator
MLVLTRKLGESILVPSHGMVIKVVAVAGGRVRLGITAPPEVQILRDEVLRRDLLGEEALTAPESVGCGAAKPAGAPLVAAATGGRRIRSPRMRAF